ncbi:PITH domain-containing protein [Iris pallida]|uniref:PITH domain-containing protein n=1 Tax=Iris pallida TaxID=29817 RepID=A0AAX6FL10_IRIPA|nr:PITH domain-containing protein [Iris pallida]
MEPALRNYLWTKCWISRTHSILHKTVLERNLPLFFSCHLDNSLTIRLQLSNALLNTCIVIGFRVACACLTVAHTSVTGFLGDQGNKLSGRRLGKAYCNAGIHFSGILISLSGVEFSFNHMGRCVWLQGVK